MTEKERMTKLRKALMRRRDVIFDAHRNAEEARRTLLEPEVEFEETSQKESLGDIMASLDEQEEKEVEAINQALARMETGDYPVCQSCGKRIPARRLEAIPWTTYCARCAKQQETGLMPESVPGEAGLLSAESAELPSALDIKAIFDELREDGAVDVEELRIAVDGGSVHLEGFLPTQAQRGRLLEVLEDHIGLANIVDELVIDPTPWQRSDRACGTKTFEDLSSELAPQEDDLGPGVFESRRSGTSLSPSDVLEPEEK
jgi:DnaK suppressor protein